MSKIKPIFRHQIYKSRKHLLNIMQCQGYNVDAYENFNPNEVDLMYNNNQLDMLLENTNANTKVYIKYFLDKKITEHIIDTWMEDLIILSDTMTKNDTLFVVTKDDLNDSTKKLLKRIWDKENIYIVIESIRRLQYNILEHVLVPRHTILSPREVVHMCIKYNVKSLTNLPEISRFDPVAKLICIRPNQVCHIQRPSKSAILCDYYRVCV